MLLLPWFFPHPIAVHVRKLARRPSERIGHLIERSRSKLLTYVFVRPSSIQIGVAGLLQGSNHKPYSGGYHGTSVGVPCMLHKTPL